MAGPHGQCNIVNVHVPSTSDNINMYLTVLRGLRREALVSAEVFVFLLGDWNLTWKVRGVTKHVAGSGAQGAVGAIGPISSCPISS
eukprot:2501239-Pyramimonas_sp.AAC.1